MLNLLKKIFGKEEVALNKTNVPKDINDLYLDMFARYDREVQPLIDRGEYKGASWEIRDISFVIKERIEDIAQRKIGSGWNYFVVLDMIVDKMQKGLKPSEDEFMRLLAYRSQIQLHINNAKRDKNNP